MESIFRGNFTLRQLAHFVVAAERGTVSGAAADLHMSQSAVSASISELERLLGAELCVRRKAQGVALTPTGQAVLQRAKDLLLEAAELEYLVRGDGRELVGPLAVGCYVTLAPTVVPPLLDGFSRAHPRVTLDFTEGAQDELADQLRAGLLDLVVMYDMDVQATWNTLVLYEVRPHILLHADHPLAGAEAVHLRDLEGEPMVLFDAPPSSRNTLAIFESCGVEPQVRHRTRSYELTRGIVGRGLGYALLIQRPRNERTYEGRPIVIKEIADDIEAARVVLVWPRGTALSPRARAFAEFARSHDLAAL